jgi:hypothetical protein
MTAASLHEDPPPTQRAELVELTDADSGRPILLCGRSENNIPSDEAMKHPEPFA